MSQWVKVEEEKPPMLREIWICVQLTHYPKMMKGWYADGDWFEIDDTNDTMKKLKIVPTHWMHLPNFPK